MPVEICPFKDTFGAEVQGLDLSRDISDADFKIWSDAFETHAVLVFHDQRFTIDQHIAFSRRFGDLEDFPDPKDQVNGIPCVIRVSNIDKYTGDIKPVEDIGHKSFTLGTSAWHTDSTFRRVPSKASLLYAVEVPPVGGDTLFANMAMAYEALSEDKKAQIEKLIAVHDFEVTRRRHSLPPRPKAVQEAVPPVRQPLVRPLEDGRKALVIGSHVDHIEGMDAEESQELLDWLTDWATQPRFVYRHEWEVGDLVMWDNRCTMHRAGSYDLAHHRRLLHRTTVAGDGPLI